MMEFSKIPIENLSHKFRRLQKIIISDVTSVVDKITELESSTKQDNTDNYRVTVIQKIASMREKLRRLADEISEESESEKLSMRRCRARLDYHYQSPSESDIFLDQNIEHRLRRSFILIGDFLLRKGLFDVVEQMVEQYDIAFGRAYIPESPIFNSSINMAPSGSISEQLDIDAFRVAHSVEQSLSNGDVTSALRWCADHSSKLNRIGSSLEFFLRQEQYLDMLFQDDRLEALQFAQNVMGGIVAKAKAREAERDPDHDEEQDGQPLQGEASHTASATAGSPKQSTLPGTFHGNSAPMEIASNDSGSSSSAAPPPSSAALTTRGRAQERQRERSRSLGAPVTSRGLWSEGGREEEVWTFPSYSPYPFLTTLASANTQGDSAAVATTAVALGMASVLRGSRGGSLSTPQWDNQQQVNRSLSLSLHVQSYHPHHPGATATSGSRTHRARGAPITSSHLEEALKRIVGLLAFQKDSSAIPDCYSLAHRDRRFKYLATVFRSEFLRVYSVPQCPPLQRMLKLGLFSLKTPACVAIAAKGPGGSGHNDHVSASATPHCSTGSGLEPSQHRVRFANDEASSSASGSGSGSGSGSTSGSSSLGPASVLSSRLSVLADALRVLQQHIPGGLLYQSQSNGAEQNDEAAGQSHRDRERGRSASTGSTSASSSLFVRGSQTGSLRSNIFSSRSGQGEDQGLFATNRGSKSVGSGSALGSPFSCSCCPVCTTAGMSIASALPTPSRGNSVLICRGSGELMGQENPPMALPNGQVFSRAFIFSNAQIMTGSGGKIRKLFTCPLTKLTVNIDEDLRPVYIIM